MMAMSIRPAFSPPAGCGMHFLKKPATTMASYTGLVAKVDCHGNSPEFDRTCLLRSPSQTVQREGGRATGSRLLPAAGGPAAVDMKDLAGDERRLLQIHHGVGDLLYLTHSAHRLQPAEKAVRLRRMHRRLDRAWRNGVHPNMTAGIFDRERASDRVEPAFRQRRKRGRQ